MHSRRSYMINFSLNTFDRIVAFAVNIVTFNLQFELLAFFKKSFFFLILMKFATIKIISYMQICIKMIKIKIKCNPSI